MERLAPETRRQRQSALLQPLNLSLIILSVLGLVVMLITNGSFLQSYAIVVSSLFINLLVLFLDRVGKTNLACHIFSIWVNLGILLLIVSNLFQEGNLAVAYIFACQLSLSVILAGLLLGVHYAFLFAGINIVAVFALLVRYFDTISRPSGEPLLGVVLDNGIPISAFLVLIAIITWLYQLALDKADKRLEVARRQIIQDELTRRDLAIARELQLRLFPPPPTTNPSLQIATHSVPARETSGDFYDFIELGEGQLGIVVADVTGKSVAAALMMALARVTIRAEARRHAAPAEVLRGANETISRDHTARQMITAFYGLLDTNALTLRFANAGHPYPILRRGDHLREIELSGIPLGGMNGITYEEYALQLEPGDQLFLLSDGLIEERNGHREMFGYDRLGPAILAADSTDPHEAVANLCDTVASFRAEAEQADDITIVVLQVAP